MNTAELEVVHNGGILVWFAVLAAILTKNGRIVSPIILKVYVLVPVCLSKA